jgi:uncharacterized protein (TIGR03066 family)
MRTQLEVAAALLLAAAVATGQDGSSKAGDFDEVKPALVGANKLPDKLVGKWVVKGGKMDGATFDFHSNGTMVGRVNVDGKEGMIKARVRVEGNKLFSVTRNPNTGKDETSTLTIKTLSARELILEDERGQVMTLNRARK